jgi:hypothetical protein
METANAKISSVSLGLENGILTAWLFLDYGGSSGQGFGGFALDGQPTGRGEIRSPSPACGFFIARVLKVVGVEKWEDLKGKSVRVVRTDGWGGTIVALGNFLEAEWFEPKIEFENLGC